MIAFETKFIKHNVNNAPNYGLKQVNTLIEGKIIEEFYKLRKETELTWNFSSEEAMALASSSFCASTLFRSSSWRFSALCFNACSANSSPPTKESSLTLERTLSYW